MELTMIYKTSHYNASVFITFTVKELGYLDELVNRDKVEDLTINLAMCMAASDGHLDQKELNILKIGLKI